MTDYQVNFYIEGYLFNFSVFTDSTDSALSIAKSRIKQEFCDLIERVSIN